ncbi:MAG: glycogen synthase [Verrucomicrobia bacterium]|nr:glycogen synthase [Verrucomicrobiota bacterium]
MYIVQIASEFAGVAKVGGLADVVQGLSRELSIRGHHVEVILPKYDVMKKDRVWGMTKCYSDLWVPYHHFWVHCDVYFGFVDGVKCFFIEPHFFKNFFSRGLVYGHKDDPERFAFFSKAALEFMLKTGKHPDIIHVHDWQTGLVPVMLSETYRGFGMTHPRVCYTIHNIHHQGVTGEFVLRQIGMNPAHFMTMERLLDPKYPNAVNIMKGGIVFSNFVTTVSPTYMNEITHTDLGHGLQGVLQYYRGKCGGVLNGLDYGEWNPEVDRFIPHKYSLGDIEGKYRNKDALRNRFWLRQEYKPIVAVVSRLDQQKGVGLIRHGIFYALANGCQFVLLGTSPEAGINNDFWSLKRQLNDNPDCHLELSFDDYLAHLIFAGADMVLVPSAFEPCGLTQLIGLKYGTVPIVRNTGGLADTVFDANYAHRPYHDRNGYVFNDFNNEGLESALRRAIGMWFHYPNYWRELMLNGMRQDHSWNHPAQDYVNIYEHIREK